MFQHQVAKIVFTLVALLILTNCSNMPKNTKTEVSTDSQSQVSDNIKGSEQKYLMGLYHGSQNDKFSAFKVEQYKHKSKAFPLNEIGTNASGITWDPYRGEYFVIQNNTGILYRYDRDFNFLGRIKKVGNMNNDTEGVSFINGRSLMIVTEANYAHRVKMDDDTIDDGYYYGESNIQLSGRPKRKNKGFEAVAFRASDLARSSRVYAGQEGSGRYPEAKMRVVYYNAATNSGTYS
ncbi:MAG: SdiA-regulated domain-containing protein, partial [Kangiellaceae bacterium]